jgi:hypothetical protein
MKVIQTILIASLPLMACSLFSPRAIPMPTPVPAENLTLPAQTTEMPVESPTPLPAATLSAEDFTPILYRNFLSRYYEFQVIGGAQAGNWLPASAIAEQIEFEQAFDVYAPSGFAGVGKAKDYSIPLVNPRCGEAYIGTDFSLDTPYLVGVKQGWQVGYRAWRAIPVDTPVYYGAVADWLRSQGFGLPAVQINRIVLVDLENDGVDEVFINAAYFKDASGHMAEQGDYSIILMRKLVGAEVVTVPVVAELYTNPTADQVFPYTYSLVNLLDLNQDGILDLVVEADRWEVNGALIYQVAGTKVVEVLRSICTQ